MYSGAREQMKGRVKVQACRSLSVRLQAVSGQPQSTACWVSEQECQGIVLQDTLWTSQCMPVPEHADQGLTRECLLAQMCDMRGPAGFVKVASTLVSSALGLLDTSKGHPANTAIMAHAGAGPWWAPASMMDDACRRHTGYATVRPHVQGAGTAQDPPPPVCPCLQASCWRCLSPTCRTRCSWRLMARWPQWGTRPCSRT